MSTPRDPDDRSFRAVLERRRPLLVVLIILCLLFVASYTTRVGTLRRLEAEQAKLEAQLHEAQVESQVLDEDLAYKTSDAFVEKSAVEEMGMVREDETVVTVLDAPATPAPEEEASALPTPAAPLEDETAGTAVWRQWLELLTGRGMN